METVSFEDFSKLKLKVAKILEAERVEGSDKLLKLQIRLGDEIRTLVAGIAEQYAEDELLGKKIIVVANLAPKKLKGIDSQGMLLAAEGPDGTLSLLSLDRDVEDGIDVH
ncbi:MAG: methionine--tRNA ligase subunit beta [Candidatus Micrarchaeota archaeon]